MKSQPKPRRPLKHAPAPGNSSYHPGLLRQALNEFILLKGDFDYSIGASSPLPSTQVTHTHHRETHENPTFWVGMVALALTVSACSTADLAEEATTPINSEVAPANGERIPGQYIVVLKNDAVAGKTVRDLVDSFETVPGIDMNHKYFNSISGFSGELSDEAYSILSNNPAVDYIEEDRWVSLPPFTSQGLCDRKPNHPNCTDGGGGDDGDGTSTQSLPWGIDRVGGAADGSSAGKAWVLDSGIDLDHPDLNVDIGLSQSFLGGKQADNPDDQNGHGTHVAGTIAAINNSEGVVGVAAGATVVSVRVLDRRGSGSYSGVIAGINYVGATGSNGDVANMSLGGGFSQAVNDAVSGASGSVKFFLAAGNESQDTNNVSPGSANGPNIWTICATTNGDGWASYSNYGSPVDYCEPGSGIESTWKNGGYNTISGTSMATPHAAGIALLGPINNEGSVTGPDGGSYTIGVR